MFLILLACFTILPIAEIALLIRIGQAIQLGPTLALVITTGIIGAALARHEGLRTLAQIQNRLAAGQMPADALVEGLLILLAGALLVTPGVITDAVGFALLIPPLRRGAGVLLARYFRNHMHVTGSMNISTGNSPFAPFGQPGGRTGGQPPRQSVGHAPPTSSTTAQVLDDNEVIDAEYDVHESNDE